MTSPLSYVRPVKPISRALSISGEEMSTDGHKWMTKDAYKHAKRLVKKDIFRNVERLSVREDLVRCSIYIHSTFYKFRKECNIRKLLTDRQKCIASSDTNHCSWLDDQVG